jgi:tight adherence protein C
MDDLGMMLIGISGVLLFMVVFLLLRNSFRPKLDVEERVRLRTDEQEQDEQGWKRFVEKLEGLFKPLGEIIPRSPEELSKHERRLVQAGIRRKDAVVLFHGAQVGLVVLLLAVCVGTGYIYRNILVAIVASIAGGVFLPELWLRRTVDARKERIQAAIPDALDLAVVCVEAGLGLDQALMRIASELQTSYPDLSEEFNLRNIEINMGLNRVDAFRNLAERTDVDDVKSLVAILIQTDRFGTSVAQALRVFAESLRVKRQQRVRERAAKLPVKMIPVMILFIFPAIFVVVVGPGMIKIIRSLVPILAGR